MTEPEQPNDPSNETPLNAAQSGEPSPPSDTAPPAEGAEPVRTSSRKGDAEY